MSDAQSSPPLAGNHTETAMIQKRLSLLALGALLALVPCDLAHAEGGQGGGRRGPRRGPPDVDKIFERFDANEDGKLTSDEVPERPWKRISEADANEDGAVTKEELKAHIESRKREGRRGRGGRGGGGGSGAGG